MRKTESDLDSTESDREKTESDRDPTENDREKTEINFQQVENVGYQVVMDWAGILVQLQLSVVFSLH